MQNSLNSYAIITHELYYGAAQALRDYLIKQKVKHLFFVSHPIKQEKPSSYTQEYYLGKFVRKHSYRTITRLIVIEYVYEMMLTLFVILKQTKKFDVIIATNPLNCIAALICKVVGRANKVIFYSIDFTPKRFPSTLMNTVYHAIETYCVKKADECWNVSPRIAEGREKYLDLNPNKYIQKIVPIGVWKKDLQPTNIARKDYSLVFVGHILKKQGIQLVVQVLSRLVVQFKNIHLTVIGGGEYLPEIRRMIYSRKLEKYTTLTDWIHDQKKVHDILLSNSVAIATYDPRGETSENFTYYADPTKLKTYLAAGLPIIMTDISYNAKDLARANCAIIVDYTEQSLYDAIVTLLSSRSKIRRMSDNAIGYMKHLTWENIFKTALSDN